MPLDHYIPQVHLRRFCSPSLGELLYAIRKSDLKTFTPSPKAVCAITNGSTNQYLREDRAIENFLRTIEPQYNSAIDKLTSAKTDRDCIYAIAGFASYVISCSPAGMRIHSGPLKHVVQADAELLEEQGLLPPAPSTLGGKKLSELICDGVVRVAVDEKYPQALGISTILDRTAIFGNSSWELLQNQFHDSPFFTSDFPAAIEKTEDPRILNRIVPLAPDLALRILPDLRAGRSPDLSFSNFRFRSRVCDRREISRLNTLLVRCAEDTVFFRDDLAWIYPFIAKNRHFRIEPHTQKIRTMTGTLLISTQRIMAATSSARRGRCST